MDCQECKGKIQIKESRNEIINDNTPDLPTEAHTCLDMACMNKSCSKYGIVIDTIRHKIEF
jgi:hypothetical protein